MKVSLVISVLVAVAVVVAALTLRAVARYASGGVNVVVGAMDAGAGIDVSLFLRAGALFASVGGKWRSARAVCVVGCARGVLLFSSF